MFSLYLLFLPLTARLSPARLLCAARWYCVLSSHVVDFVCGRWQGALCTEAIPAVESEVRRHLESEGLGLPTVEVVPQSVAAVAAAVGAMPPTDGPGMGPGPAPGPAGIVEGRADEAFQDAGE